MLTITITITDHAAQQLKDIYQFSTDIWGKLKAKEYMLNLHKTINRLADSLSIAMRNANVICYFPSQSHIIYFAQQPNSLAVLAVLHKSYLPSNDPALQ